MNESTHTGSVEPTQPVSKGRGNGLLGLGLAIVFASAAFFSGLQIGSDIGGSDRMEAGLFSLLFTNRSAPADGVELDQFWRVWNLLEEKYVASTSTEPVTDEERIHGAISGLVASYGDPYTVFLPPADAEQFSEDISGNFGGVGMEVGLRDGLITVISPLPDTPAERAGIVAGDVIVRIDGEDTDDMNVDEAVQLIRGEEGTDVELTLYREGEIDFITVAVTRDIITIPTIETERIGDVYIIRLYSFNALAEAKMREELTAFSRSGATKLILDLRGNPGGFLNSAVAIGGYFLPSGKVIVREDYGEGRDADVYRSNGRVIHEFTPETLVVLTNEGSASASEILAGALKEHGVATLIGENTFGKGSVQELVDLPDGSSLKVTIARWLTPEGTSFSEVGLAPNIMVTMTPQQVVDGEDPQQEAALRWLRGERDVGDPPNTVSKLFDTESDS